MNNEKLLTIQEFAELAGVSKQTVYKQLNNRLNPYCQLVDNRKMLKSSALLEIYGVSVEQPSQPKVDSFVNQNSTEEIKFLRAQVERLQAELEKEREHNRETDRQLLDTLNKLAESQAALSAGQAADKQKALAEKIIEGKQRFSDEMSGADAPQGFFRKIKEKKNSCKK